MVKTIRGMKVRCKPESVMHDCIGLHGLMGSRDIPASCKNDVPKDELWIRNDHCNHGELTQRNIVLHEDAELLLMEKYKLTYQVAHNAATVIENKYKDYKRRLKHEMNVHI